MSALIPARNLINAEHGDVDAILSAFADPDLLSHLHLLRVALAYHLLVDPALVRGVRAQLRSLGRACLQISRPRAATLPLIDANELLPDVPHITA
ncbi:MAG TPA: hypothetical protein VMG10_10730 [Gemmataceae bacterium]|nr:hypothetical protein [Gemmataceae bacterium]